MILLLIVLGLCFFAAAYVGSTVAAYSIFRCRINRRRVVWSSLLFFWMIVLLWMVVLQIGRP